MDDVVTSDKCAEKYQQLGRELQLSKPAIQARSITRQIARLILSEDVDAASNDKANSRVDRKPKIYAHSNPEMPTTYRWPRQLILLFNPTLKMHEQKKNQKTFRVSGL